MKRDIKPIAISLASFIGICIVCLLSACGGGGDDVSGDAPSGAGSISFRLDWIHPGPQRGFEKSPSGDVCVDYLIETVSATVQDPSGTTSITQTWDCSARQGTIDTVPEGSGYSLAVDGVVAGRVDWHTQITGITVTGNQDTNVGTIEMAYQGDDKVPPEVSDHYPANEDTDVLRNINITATFSEDVVADSARIFSTLSIDDATSTPVSCTVNYNASTRTVIIHPDSHLAEHTTYRVTITKAVQDHAGQMMASDASWTFTTGVAIGGLLVWDGDEAHWDESLWQ